MSKKREPRKLAPDLKFHERPPYCEEGVCFDEAAGAITLVDAETESTIVGFAWLCEHHLSLVPRDEAEDG
jgi:hypothetical protein